MEAKFGVQVSRIRVDLRGDIFVDAEVPLVTIHDHETFEGVIHSIKSSGGSIVERDGNQITWDTADLTIYGEIIEL